MKKGNGPVFDGKARRMIEDMIATEKRQIEERRLQEECACKDGMFPRVDRRHLLFAAGSSAGTLALAALTRRTAAEGLKAPPGAQAGLSNYTLPPATTLGGVKQGAGVSIASASGSLQQTTGSMTAGSATLTLASALDFANGQGLRVTGAGPAFSLNAPTSLADA